MSGSGNLQPNSGLRYHTDADSPLPETINPIIDAVESVASKKHITESGSNENGHYIKFDDGTMECYLVRAVENYTLSNAYGTTGLGFNYYDWPYPKPFISVPHVAVGRAQIGSGAQWGSTRQNSLTNAQAVVWGAVGNTGLLNITLHATGRWK